MNWTQQQSIELCNAIEKVCPKHGCHVALTGGCLYKKGERDDCDILFYRIRQVERIDQHALWAALLEIGIEIKSGCDWCFKARYHGKKLDIFFPEDNGYEYPDHEEDEADTLTLRDYWHEKRNSHSQA